MNADERLRSRLVETPEPLPPFTGTVEQVVTRARRRRRRSQAVMGGVALAVIAGIALPLGLLEGLHVGGDTRVGGATSGPVGFVCPREAVEPHPHQVPGTLIYMVPGSPQSLTACRYHGLNQAEPAGSLAGSASLPPTEIARALNEAKEVPPEVVFHCPIDFGDAIDLYFHYADGSVLEVHVPTSGCTFATNGHRSVFAPRATLANLATTLGRDHQPR